MRLCMAPRFVDVFGSLLSVDQCRTGTDCCACPFYDRRGFGGRSFSLCGVIGGLRSARELGCFGKKARCVARREAALRDTLCIERDHLEKLAVVFEVLLILLRRVDEQFKHCLTTASFVTRDGSIPTAGCFPMAW
jgi:hypothetical protein